MTGRHLLIVGGGLAGLAAGCYGRANGFRTTIVEHNRELGGVCTAWTRGQYTVDGCIHWLTGGPFVRLYEELHIVPDVPLRRIEQFVTYQDVSRRFEVPVTRDLHALAASLEAMAPEDTEEIRRMMRSATELARLDPGFERPAELRTPRDALESLWGMRHELGALAHYRKPVNVWAKEHLKSARLGRFLSLLAPDGAPALLVLVVLGYLQQGFLSRPAGGTVRFRDALIARYRALGGEARVSQTVDEILVKDGRASGVRFADGTVMEADVVISTASAPETTLHLLGGRYGADELRTRLDRWKLVRPIVLVSFGVADPLPAFSSPLLIDGIEPLEVGGYVNDHLYVRAQNDDPTCAPPGHTVVQVMLQTDYDWWATRSTRYGLEKDRVAELTLQRLERHLPGIRPLVRLTDVATPLTFWNTARSWRGAFEGWIPTPEAFFGHVKKTLPGLSRFFMAGQWVEPGGGVPTAILSGRQALQLVCAEEERPFVAA